jgi:ketosteroid isomerase-like protein
MKIVLGVLLALVTFAAPGYGQERSPVLDKLIAGFVTAFNAKDMTALAAFYADDAVWLRPNAPLMKGRSALEAAFKKQFTDPAVLKLTPTESMIAGNYGFSVGTYTVTVPTIGGGSMTYAAKYLTVFERVGNDWKIAYDMQNADQPPPTAP